MSEKEDISCKRFADLILDMGTYLLASGAHCGRVNSNLKRLGDTWGFDINVLPTFNGLIVSVQSIKNPNASITLFKEAPSHIVHLQILTEVSLLTWRVYEQKMSIEDTEKAFTQIKKLPTYNHWVVSVAVGFSCAGLCFFADGDIFNAIIVWLGAFVGSLCRFRISKMKFNPLISISVAAFVTTLITSIGSLYNIGSSPEAAMATAVLYLIPGVPLINSVIDLIEGYLSSSINRAMFAALTVLTIAVGMTLCITLLGIDNFKL